MTSPDLTVLLTIIASEELGLDTLETRNSDHLDFHDLPVCAVRRALARAFAAGVDFATSTIRKEQP